MNKFTNALGLDVGAVRIGVARINSIAKIAEPLMVLQNNDAVNDQINRLTIEYNADLIVVGLPRNMSGETTKQTEYVRDFVEELIKSTSINIVFQDETLSTVAASQRMTIKTKNIEDAVAAAVILEDFLITNDSASLVE